MSEPHIDCVSRKQALVALALGSVLQAFLNIGRWLQKPVQHHMPRKRNIIWKVLLLRKTNSPQKPKKTQEWTPKNPAAPTLSITYHHNNRPASGPLLLAPSSIRSTWGSKVKSTEDMAQPTLRNFAPTPTFEDPVRLYRRKSQNSITSPHVIHFFLCF